MAKYNPGYINQLMAYVAAKAPKTPTEVLNPHFFDGFLEGKSPEEVADIQLSINQLLASIRNAGHGA